MRKFQVFLKNSVPGSRDKEHEEQIHIFFFFFLRFLIYFIFRERGRKGEREGKTHQCVVISCTPSTGDLAYNPDICPDWELNR